MSSGAAVEHVLETLRAVIAGQTGYERAHVRLRSAREVNFDLSAAHNAAPPDSAATLELALCLEAEDRGAWHFAPVQDRDSLRGAVEICLAKLAGATAGSARGIAPFTYEGDISAGLNSDDTFALIPNEEKINRLVNLEELVRKDLATASEITAAYAEGSYREALWNSVSNRPLVCEWSDAQISLTIAAERDGHRSTISESVYEAAYFDLDWTHLARSCAQTVGSLLAPSPADLAGIRMILHPHVAASFVALLGEALNGYAYVSGNSFLSGRRDTMIFAPVVNVFDDPLFRKKARSRFWDVDGQATRRIAHVQGGRFGTPSVPNSLSTKWELEGTSQMRAATGLGPSELSFHNLILEPGTKDYVDLIRELDTGALITRLDKIESFDARTGDFRAKVSGQRLRSGQVHDAFAEVDFNGNLERLFATTTAVGRDLRWLRGVAAPSILCENGA